MKAGDVISWDTSLPIEETGDGYQNVVVRRLGVEPKQKADERI